MSHVLVADDDPTVGGVIRLSLEREGLVVEMVGDGRLALERALRCQPDLIVLDPTLPGPPGWEVCRQLREVSSVPIVMLRALAEANDRILGLELGADDYVVNVAGGRIAARDAPSSLRRSYGGRGVPAFQLGRGRHVGESRSGWLS